jgi:hypothetical protein
MNPFKNVFRFLSKPKLTKDDDDDTLCSHAESPHTEQEGPTRRPMERCTDWNHATLLQYGDPVWEAQHRQFKGHKNQGYFSSETEIAPDYMYQK